MQKDPGGPLAPTKRATWRVVELVGLGLVALAQAVVGWHLVFQIGFSPVDDEGYLVVLLREWVGGGALYDEVYSQYGPFHAVVFGVPLRLLGIDLSLTLGREITLVLLVATGLLLAVAVLALTHSFWCAVVAQLAAFLGLSSIATASMHPGGLIVFLLAISVVNVIVLRPRSPVISDGLTGAVGAALLLTKVNVGIFFVAVVVYLVAATWPTPAVRRVLRPLTEVGLVVLGPLLLLSQWGTVDGLPAPVAGITEGNETQTLVYWSVAYAAAALAVVVFARWWEPGDERSGPAFALGPLIAGFGAVVLCTVGVVVVTGTSPGVLVDAVVIRPLGQGDALTVLPTLAGWSLLWLAALPVLLLGARAIVRPPATTARLVGSGALRLGAGALLLVASVPQIAPWFRFELVAGPLAYVPFAALVLVPPAGGGPARRPRARWFLASLAVVQSLHAFPVAGVQLSWSLLLPAACGAVLIADATREWAEAAVLSERSLGGRLARSVPAVAAVALLLLTSWSTMIGWVDDYRDATPLALPSSGSIRLPEAQVATYRALVDELDDCEVILSDPGWNGLYLLADSDPPTGFNATLWRDLLDDEEQQAVVDALDDTDGRVCLVTNAFTTAYLTQTQGPSDAERPLAAYLSSGFEPVAERDGYQVLVRADP